MSQFKSNGFTLIEIMVVIAIIGVLAAIALPQYQTHVARTQAARAMAEAGALKSMIETCIVDGKTTLGSAASQCDPGVTGSTIMIGNAQFGPALAVGTGVPFITFNPSDTTIIATFGNAAVFPLTVAGANSMTWHRGVNGAWTCTATIAAKYRPRGCESYGS